MKKTFISILAAAFAALLSCSCEPMEKTGDQTGTVVGSWRLETCLIEVKTTVNGNTSVNSSTTNYSGDHVYLFLGEKFLATGYYNLEMEAAAYNYDAEKGTIRFSDGISVSDNGKAMVLLGTYQVEITGNKMVLKQAFGVEAASRQTAYIFHREERKE